MLKKIRPYIAMTTAVFLGVFSWSFAAALKLEAGTDTSATGDAASYYERGRALYYQKDYDGAKGEFRKALSIDPENSYSNTYLELCALNADNPAVAGKKNITTEDLKLGLELQALYQKGQEAYYRGNYSYAKDIFEKISEKNPDFKEVFAYIELCNVRLESSDKRSLVKSGQEEDAAARLNKQNTSFELKTIADSAVDAYFQQAKESYYKGDFNNAQEAFKKVISTQPDYPYADAYLELCLINLETPILIAAKEIGPASAENEELQKAYQDAQETYLKQDYLRAKEMFEKIFARNPSYMYVSSYLGLCNSRLGIQEMVEARGFRDPGYCYRKADEFIRSGDYRSAKLMLEKVINIDPLYYNTQSKLIICNNKLKDQKIQEMLKKNAEEGRIGELYANAKALLYRNKDCYKAKAVFEEVLKLAPEDMKAKKYIAMCDNMIAIDEEAKKITSQVRAFPQMSRENIRAYLRKIKLSGTIISSVEYDIGNDKTLNSIDSEMITSLTPSFLVTLPVEDMGFTMGYSTTLRHFRDGRPTVNQRYGFDLSLKHDVSKRISYEISEHLSRASLNPTEVDVLLGKFGFTQVNVIAANIKYALAKNIGLYVSSSYDTSTQTNPAVTTSNDMHQFLLDLGLTREVSRVLTFYGDYVFSRASFATGDIYGRSGYDLNKIKAGVKYVLGRLTSINASAGFEHRDYLNNKRGEGIEYELTVNKALTARDRMSLAYTRAVENTDRLDYLQSLTDRAGLTYSHDFTKRTLGTITGSYIRSNYVPSDYSGDIKSLEIKSEYFGVMLNLTHMFTKWLSASLNYDKSMRQSSFGVDRIDDKYIASMLYKF